MTRVIRKSQVQSSREAAHLLEAIFAAELVRPSKCLWLVSPWISDIPLIDNSTNSFQPLGAWGPRRVRLSEVLLSLALLGSSVVVGTTPDHSNSPFLERVRRLFREQHLDDSLTVDIDRSGKLHEKAITGDDFALVGSMNITNNGVFLREEFVEFRMDEEFVARARMDAYERFGGIL